MVTAITDGDDRDQTDKAPVDANPASVRFRWAEREQDRAEREHDNADNADEYVHVRVRKHTRNTQAYVTVVCYCTVGCEGRSSSPMDSR